MWYLLILKGNAMRESRLTSRKFILAILGLLTMIVSPEVAPYVVGLLTVAITAQGAIDYKRTNENKDDKK
jgi:hypothetical protein